MKFSFFSLVMSVIFFNFYISIIHFLRKRNKFIVSFSIFPIILLIILSIFRVIFNFEFKNSIYINSKVIYPKIIDILRTPIYTASKTTISKVLLWIWILGAIVVLFRSIYFYFKFKKDLNNISKIKLEKDLIILEAIKKYLNIEKNNNISIYRYNEIITPFVVGVFDYSIYLPNINIAENDLENVLLHEVNHILGKDNLKKILILLLEIIFWWNPFVYVFNKDVAHIFEIQCDLRTTSFMNKENRIRYLESIINMIKSIKNKTSTIPIVEKSLEKSALYNNDSKKMKQRFNLVLNYYNKNKVSKKNKILLYSIIVILFIASYIFTLKPYYYPTEEGIFREEGYKYRKSDNSKFIFKKN